MNGIRAGVPRSPAQAGLAATSRHKAPPMHLAFDVFMETVKTAPEQQQLLMDLKKTLKKGDRIWLAVEGSTVARDPAVLDRLAAEKKAWQAVLGPMGVQVETRIRFERIHTDFKSSAQYGMQDVYKSILEPRKLAHQPTADSVSYDYELHYGFSGGEYSPHDTAKAAQLFSLGQRIAKAMGVPYFVEPSTSQVFGGNANHQVTLNWEKLARYTDGFNFQTQRIVAGTGNGPVSRKDIVRDRSAYARVVGNLVEGLKRDPASKKAWAMCQLSTEWSQPATAVAAAARARDAAPDIKAYYLWWEDPGRTEQTNVNRLMKFLGLWNKTFRPQGPGPGRKPRS